MKQNKFTIRKIPIASLLENLQTLVNNNVEYVDVVGIIGEHQDTIGLIFSSDYMKENNSLSINDINNLTES